MRSLCVGAVAASLAGANAFLSVSSAQAAQAAQEGRTSGERGPLMKDGTFEGTARSFGGPLSVSVSVENGYLTDISVTRTGDTDSYLSLASEKLIPEIEESQSWDLDTVSSATYSSHGIMNAVNNALVNGGAAEGSTARTSMTTSSSAAHSTSELKRIAQTRADEDSAAWYELTVGDLLGQNASTEEQNATTYGYTLRQQSDRTH